MISIGDTVLSFDNDTGKMSVLRTDGIDEWEREPCALCRCLEPHPHGYEVGYEGWWLVKELKKIK